MKKSWVGSVVKRGSGVVALMLLAAGVLVGQNAVAGIASTKHNLGTTGTGANHLATGNANNTAEICVFCHTPHGGDTSASVPLWNKKLGTSGSYTTYNSLGTSSLDGATAPVGSVSLACLSCHDGSQAMSVMINAPGSGGYVAGGVALSGSTWAAGGNVTAGGAMSGTATGTPTNIALIGTDLRNDHPIGIQYGGGLVNNASYGTADVTSASLRDSDFATAKYVNLNNNNVWYVESGTVGSGRQKTDMMLYTRTGTTPIMTSVAGTSSGTMSGDQAFVECASCHDPHSSNVTFLRIPNTGSAVCLTCHVK